MKPVHDPDDERRVLGLGFCNAHYIRWKRHGQTGAATVAPQRRTLHVVG